MSDTQTIEARTREFILKTFPLARKQGITAGGKWLENGTIDSLGILDLVHFLETEFSVQISDEELVPENFDSLAAVMEFTRQKLGQNSTSRV